MISLPLLVCLFPKFYVHGIIRHELLCSLFSLGRTLLRYCFVYSILSMAEYSLMRNVQVVYQINCLQIFSPSLWLSSHCLQNVFQKRTVFNFDCALCILSPCNSKSQRFSPMFSSRSFMALWHTSRTVVIFELCFVYGMRRGLQLISSHMDVKSSRHLLFSKSTLCSSITLVPLLKVNVYNVFISECYSVS